MHMMGVEKWNLNINKHVVLSLQIKTFEIDKGNKIIAAIKEKEYFLYICGSNWENYSSHLYWQDKTE